MISTSIVNEVVSRFIVRSMRVLVVVFIFFISQAHAEYNFNTSCKQAYKEIIFLKFNSAKQLLEKEKKVNPNNLMPYYIENYISFFQLFLGENKADYKILQKELVYRIKKLEQGNKKSPYYKYCLADVYLQWAFLRVKFGDMLTSAYEINKAYTLLEANKKQFPEFIPNDKGLGLLHSLIGSIPDNYKWLTSVIGIKGSVEQGINELQTVYQIACVKREYNYLKTESLFMLTFLKLNLQTGDARFVQLKNLFKQFNDSTLASSPLLVYCRAIVALKSFDAKTAEKILEKYKEQDGQYPFYYLNYLTGLSKFYRLDLSAANYFVYFLNHYSGVSYVQSAYQKLAWTYLLLGKNERYTFYMQEIIKHELSQTDEDKQAYTEAKAGEIPNILLLKARLLFDGGFYEKAYLILSDKTAVTTLKSAKDQLEYMYRLARILHEQNKIEEAIGFYKKTIDKGKTSKYYYAANASLELGYIYEKLKNYSLAQYYYLQSTTLNNQEYKNSIDQKAKAGINRLKTKTGNP